MDHHVKKTPHHRSHRFIRRRDYQYQGGLITDEVNIARYVDVLIGITPIINLEWIQKIQRDKTVRGYSSEDATGMILERMHDYVHYITPQFSRTDINLQRVPPSPSIDRMP